MFKPHGDKHFMVDESLLARLIDYANVGSEDTVLEVGAGTGNLTKHISGVAGEVIAVEKEESLFRILKKKFSDSVQLVHVDILKVSWPKFNKCVSNIPYSISRKFIVKLLQKRFKVAVLVVQYDFAEKLLAKAGSENYRFISALTQSTSEVEILEKITPDSFAPRPNVTSAAVRITPRITAESDYIVFLNNLFNHKNKKIRNILEDAPEDVGQRRPYELKPEELLSFYKEYKKSKSEQRS